MIKKKIGGSLIAIMLCMSVIMSITVMAAGEEISSQPTGSETAGSMESVLSEPESAPSELQETEPPATEQPATEPLATEPPKPENTTMKVSDEMLRVLKQLEGFNPHAYWDYKQYSIGYGSKCPAGYELYYSSVEDGGQGHKISEEYAEQLLRGELDYFENVINNFIKRNNLTLSQHQYDALVSFSYNTGASWTNGTTGNFNSAVISGDTGSHFIYGMMLWSMAGNRHILINRRIVETNIYANGVYPANVYAPDAIPDRYRIAFMDGNGGVVKYDEHGFDAEKPIPIKTVFKSHPTGPDETGAIVTYEFDGWYTERIGGTKVEQLDTSIPTGTVLYAHWKTPGGTPVIIPRLESGLKVTVTVTHDGVNVRSGPDTYYHSFYKAYTGEMLEISEITTRGGLLWGRSGSKWIALKYTDYADALDQLLPLWGRVTSTTLNVRTGAGTDYALVPNVQKAQGDFVLVSEWKSDGTMMWGRIDEGWIALPYVTFDGVLPPNETVVSITISQNPTKLSYLHKLESLDLSGGKLLITYADGSTQTVDITPEMASGFDNTTAGEQTVTVTYGEMTTTFAVQIIKAKVIFQMEDGTVISEKEYLIGETVEIPADPTKPGATFIGWDREIVTVCDGNATYTAAFVLSSIPGDFDGNGEVTQDDAVYLLLHTMFGEAFYPLNGAYADINGDGTVDQDDAVYLLLHTMFGESFYPLNTPATPA